MLALRFVITVRGLPLRWRLFVHDWAGTQKLLVGCMMPLDRHSPHPIFLSLTLSWCHKLIYWAVDRSCYSLKASQKFCCCFLFHLNWVCLFIRSKRSTAPKFGARSKMLNKCEFALRFCQRKTHRLERAKRAVLWISKWEMGSCSVAPNKQILGL